LVNLPVGVAALVVTRWQVDESKTPHASRPDWAGSVMLTAGLVSLVYGLIRAGEMAWSETGVDICLALAAVFFVAFVALEHRVDHPLFDLSLFRIPTFSGGLAAAFAMNGSLYGYEETAIALHIPIGTVRHVGVVLVVIPDGGAGFGHPRGDAGRAGREERGRGGGDRLLDRPLLPVPGLPAASWVR
jgi:hypothetical protein